MSWICKKRNGRQAENQVAQRPQWEMDDEDRDKTLPAAGARLLPPPGRSREDQDDTPRVGVRAAEMRVRGANP